MSSCASGIALTNQPIQPKMCVTLLEEWMQHNGLIVSSALDSYMARVNSLPVLTAEEEFDLAVHFQKEHDLNAAEKMVTSNLRFVVKIAHESFRS